MTYYRVRKEYDQKPRMKYGRRGGLEWDSIYIGGELFTEKELEKEYKTHLVGLAPEKLFEKVEISKRRVCWFFGARKEIPV